MIYYFATRIDMANKTNKLKVYLESSFVSYVTGRETTDLKIAECQVYTRRWVKEQAAKCDCCISQFVIDESVKGPRADVDRRIEFIEAQRRLEFDMSKVRALAAQLLAGHALPEKEATDALHIAVASVTGMDVLLTWNCSHMANPHTLPKTKAIVRKAGYQCPDIMTPKTFLENLELELVR